MLADSHCHLDWFENPVQIVENSRKAGVQRILSNSTSFESIGKNLSLSKEFSEVLACIGIHPANVFGMGEDELERSFSLVEKNIAKACAVGEVGLDFKYASTPEKRVLQERVFRKFISIALAHEKPVVVHARYAETRCLDILEEMGADKVHMHWFTNSKKTSARAVSLGYFISCGPIIFSDNASAGVVKAIPLENLLLETDAPVKFSGETSEPSWIPEVCKKASALKGVRADELALATGKNFSSLFGEKL